MLSLNMTDIIIIVNSTNWASIMFARCWSIIMFILGIVGHSLSIYVFTRPTLRVNPCARYFLSSSVTGYCIIFVTIPLRTLQIGYNINLFVYSISICKILSFVMSSTRILPSWFIVLACGDRFLQSSSSAVLRSWSSVRIANRTILVTILFVCLINIHVLIYFIIIAEQSLCTGQLGIYKIFYSFFNLIVWGLIPSFAMIIFGLLTIRHVHQGRRRIVNQNNLNTRQQNLKSIDRQLIKMMIVQSFVFYLSASSASIGSMYISSSGNSRDPIIIAKNNFITNILSYFGLIGSCTSFYLFTLSSKLFRRELFNLFRHH